MKIGLKYLICVIVMLSIALPAYADTTNIYVDLNSPVDGPGTAWSNAFHTIQQGIDAPVYGIDVIVLVNDGVYEVGEKVVSGSSIKNRVYMMEVEMVLIPLI